MDFSLFSHLKLLVGINLLRYSKGNKVGTIYSNSKKLAKLLSRDKEGQRLNQEFENHYSLSLDSLTLSELFSNYLKEGLIFRQNHQYELLLLRAKTRKLTLRHWERNFRQLESKTNIPLTKKPDVACKLHNAIILQEEDYHLNFLVYDYRQDFLGYFKRIFPSFTRM
ncbi:hypothetical protein N1495_08975 [Streptococcus didelphis]|uniref:M protein trans-acting positive regulator PRD domain-containing protein n=1 Tax=Streptococcus didelphis TaxID=102886 RepID=UPI0027D2F7FA|nr:M protein trans-acting positive regulator PRD domain-containing protein [Streptococcus didelphis]WMB30201.1 hypothetical protein N1495_08975 [Streptococcus didelphis]